MVVVSFVTHIREHERTRIKMWFGKFNAIRICQNCNGWTENGTLQFIIITIL